MAIIKPSKPNTFINGAGNTADANEVNENFDILYAKEGEIIDAVNGSAGTKATPAARLAVSMNDDGTMKTAITSGGEWINPGLAATFISSTQFSVAGNHTDIYLADRRVKITVAAGVVYSAVVSSAHSSGVTTVTVGAVLTDPITSVEHSTVRPIASSGAVSAQMVGAYTKGQVDTEVSGAKAYTDTHEGKTAPHSGHETPAGAQTKVTTHANLTNPHSATAAATANRLMLRDAAGRSQIVPPSVAADIANKGYVDSIVQVVRAELATVVAVSTVIPVDDTIPQSSEGTEIITATITPKKAGNTILITFSAFLGAPLSTIAVTACFVGSETNARAVTANTWPVGSVGYITTPLSFTIPTVSTAAITVRIRMGNSNGHACFVGGSGQTGGRLFGTAPKTFLELVEIAA